VILLIRLRGVVQFAACSLFLIALPAGCLQHQLEFTTSRTLNTLPDIHYQQVMDNLAAVASNPGRLPYLAVAGQGAVQVTDNGSSTLSLSIPLTAASPDLLGIGVTRNVTGTWSLGTITSPDKIRGMQAIYQRALAGAAHGDPAFRWLNSGAKRDVPPGASYVGRFGDVAVWVMPEGIAGLSELALAVLDVATREDSPMPPGSSARDWPRGNVPRRNFQLPATGPVFTPGAG
jgi:hypothetical protein